MNRTELKLHVRGLGLTNHKRPIGINISHSYMHMWDDFALEYKDIDDELAELLMDSTEFDYDFFCVLVGSLDLDAMDALALSLS